MWLKNLFRPAPAPALLLLQREPAPFSTDSLLAAVQPHWEHSLTDTDLYWNIESPTPGFAQIGLGGAKIVVSRETDLQSYPSYMQDKMPPPAERTVWPPHAERLDVECYAHMSLSSEQRFAVAAKVALSLLTANCVAVYDSFNRRMLPASPATFAELQRIAAALPPLEKPTAFPRIAITLLLCQPVPLDEASLHAAGERAWQRAFADSKFLSTLGNPPHLSIDYNSVHFRQATPPFPPDDPRHKPTLPPPQEREAWGPHQARLTLFSDYYMNEMLPEYHGTVAKVALAFLDANCVGVYDSIQHTFWAHPADAIPALQAVAERAPKPAA